MLTRLDATRIIAAAIAALASFRALAGPPFVTDDPEPVEHRRWEVNYALTYEWGRGVSSTGVPSVDINYGAAPNVQLHAQPRYSREKSGDEVHSGIDDTEIGVKYRFIDVEAERSAFMVGIYPMYQVATGKRALGPDRGRGQMFLPLWIQRDSDKWTIYGGWGYRINPGVGNRNSLFSGVTGLYSLSPRIQLGAEIFHETAGAVGAPNLSGFNVGSILTVSRDYNLLFSVGKRSDADVEQALYIALQAHF